MIGRIKIKGLKELEKKLANLDNAASGKALYSALNAAATPMVKTAKERAALAPEPHKMAYGKSGYVKVEPGLLKSAIRRRRLKRKEYTAIKQGAAIGIYIGKGTKQKLYPRYWHFIEYGTRKMPATPFIRPAFDENKEKSVEIFAKKLKSNIDKALNVSTWLPE